VARALVDDLEAFDVIVGLLGRARRFVLAAQFVEQRTFSGHGWPSAARRTAHGVRGGAYQ
jgi:hypothetical protein